MCSAMTNARLSSGLTVNLADAMTILSSDRSGVSTEQQQTVDSINWTGTNKSPAHICHLGIHSP